jgi:hypothetical protein
MNIYKNAWYGGKQFCVSHSMFLNEIRIEKCILVYVGIFSSVLRVLFTKLKNYKFSELPSFFKTFLMTAIWLIRQVLDWMIGFIDTL